MGFWQPVVQAAVVNTHRDEAVKYAEAAVAFEPAAAPLRVGLARLLRDAGQPDRATQELNEAIRRSPNLAEAQALLGEWKLAAGDRAGGLESLKKAAELGPKQFGPVYQKAADMAPPPAPPSKGELLPAPRKERADSP